MLTIALESPTSPEGRNLIEGSQQALLAAFSPEDIFTLDPEELATPDTRFFVARLGGTPTGCVALVDCGTYAEVKRLFVTEAGRGRGVARALMAALEADAAGRAKTLIRLETGAPLAAAVALYTALGYCPRGPFGDYADHPSSLFMEKHLTEADASLPPTTGRCLCGRVSFEFRGLPLWQSHCHCESCRRTCSAPFTSFVGVRDGTWRWTGAAPALYRHTAAADRLFCAACGSPMAFRGERWPGEMHFYAASLTDPTRYIPTRQVNWSEHTPRIRLADGLPTDAGD